MEAQRRRVIISAYGEVLAKATSLVKRENDLPFPKEVIRTALREELEETEDLQLRNSLELGLLMLEDFRPEEEAEAAIEGERLLQRAAEICKTDAPQDIQKAAELLNQSHFERYVEILGKLRGEAREQFKDIQTLRHPTDEGPVDQRGRRLRRIVPVVIKFLRGFAKVWVILSILINVIAIAGHLLVSPNLWVGIVDVQEWYSPFNPWNWLAELVLVSPAIGAWILAAGLDRSTRRWGRK